MKKNPSFQKLMLLVEDLIEHNLFKPITVSIITSFILFNGFSYLKIYLQERKEKAEKYATENPIKIDIPKDKAGFGLNENQVTLYQMKSGDALLKILLDIGAKDTDVFNILAEMKKIYDPKSINIGDKILIKYKVKVAYDNKDRSKTNREVVINDIEFTPTPEKKIIINLVQNTDGTSSYRAREIKKVLTKHILKYSATIKNGLFVDGTDAGISPTIMMNMINLYSFDVDFQRDIREGDKFEVLFESYYDETGNRVKDGNVLFTSLNLQTKRTIDMYLYKNGSRSEYFDGKGNSIRKSLLKTPINGARISSPFGMRRHPVLSYSKMHKGIDFAAPTGTPIFAAGDGTITYYGRKGGYGNFVGIRHNKDYATGYGHASRFVRRLHVGSRVKQGDIVAYVGSTGRSTGPHLHYEVVYKGKQINPGKVKGTSGLRLVGRELSKFLAGKAEIDGYLKNTPNQNKL